MLIVAALVLALSVTVLSLGVVYEPAAMAVGLLWSIMITMFFLLISFDLAWVQKIIPPDAETVVNRHFKRYEKFFQRVLWAMLLLAILLVSIGAPLQFIVMHGGMTVLSLSFSTMLSFLPLLLSKDVSITRSFTVVLSVLSAMSLIASLVCISLTWPLCQNIYHACPRPSVFSLGTFPLLLSLLGIFVTATREVMLVTSNRSMIARTVEYSTATAHLSKSRSTVKISPS
jgi:hypothetical protein